MVSPFRFGFRKIRARILDASRVRVKGPLLSVSGLAQGARLGYDAGTKRRTAKNDELDWRWRDAARPLAAGDMWTGPGARRVGALRRGRRAGGQGLSDQADTPRRAERAGRRDRHHRAH